MNNLQDASQRASKPAHYILRRPRPAGSKAEDVSAVATRSIRNRNQGGRVVKRSRDGVDTGAYVQPGHAVGVFEAVDAAFFNGRQVRIFKGKVVELGRFVWNGCGAARERVVGGDGYDGSG